jgi:hypothetical protein
MDAPAQVKLAIGLSAAVLLSQFGNSLWQIAMDPEASADHLFRAIWLIVTLVSAVITALFIFFAWRRRNWARIALLLLTLAYWAYWIVWPPVIEDYPWWKWGIAALVMATQACALILLFSGKATRWYYPDSGSTGAL